MTTATIGVSGATGKTGQYVVQQMLEAGFPVRAFIHKHDERADRLSAMGAEPVVIDLLRLESLRPALEGIDRAYFCYPTSEKILEATTAFAAAATDSGVTSIVNMSQICARHDAPSPTSRLHWLAERVLDWTEIGTTHIRPSFFADLIKLYSGKSIASQGKIIRPYGKSRHAPVPSDDIARVISACLKSPEDHTGKVYTVTGPESLTFDEIAAVISEVLGKPISYIDATLSEWESALREIGLRPDLIEHHKGVTQDMHDGVFDQVTDVVRDVGGSEPKTLADFIAENSEAFGGLSAAT